MFSASLTPIRRSNGRTMTAAAAYRAACKIIDQATGEVHDYRRKRGVVSSHLLAPIAAPDWACDRDRLWNEAEAAERRINSRVGSEMRVALPHELTDEQRQALALEYGAAIRDRYQTVVDLSLHRADRGGDVRNEHMHMLFPDRAIGEDGFGNKLRALHDRKTGPAEIEWMRAKWAECANRALERAEISKRIDHRSYAERGIDKLPTRHVGPKLTAAERRGISTRIGRYNRRVGQRNQAAENRVARFQALREQLQNLERQATVAVHTVVDFARDAGRKLSTVLRQPSLPPQAAVPDPHQDQRGLSLEAQRGPIPQTPKPPPKPTPAPALAAPQTAPTPAPAQRVDLDAQAAEEKKKREQRAEDEAFRRWKAEQSRGR